MRKKMDEAGRLALCAMLRVLAVNLSDNIDELLVAIEALVDDGYTEGLEAAAKVCDDVSAHCWPHQEVDRCAARIRELKP